MLVPKADEEPVRSGGIEDDHVHGKEEQVSKGTFFDGWRQQSLLQNCSFQSGCPVVSNLQGKLII